MHIPLARQGRRSEVFLGGQARSDDGRLRHAGGLHRYAPALRGVGTRHWAHPLCPHSRWDMCAQDVVHHRAAHIVVALPAEHVVALMVLVDGTEVGRVAQDSDPVARGTYANWHAWEAVHRRVQHVPNEGVYEHAGQQDGKRLEQAEAEQRKDRQRRGQHLDRHQARDWPGEGSAAEPIRVQRGGCLCLSPPVILLERHVVVRFSVMLNMSTTEDFDEIVASVRLAERAATQPEGHSLAEALQRMVAVKLLVLVPTVCGVLVGRHECIECRKCGNFAEGSHHHRLGTPRGDAQSWTHGRQCVHSIY
mmetsp:Transcript_34780/g.69297  ORF Transcript_34780/g.69297 Transcript_34780/m.69297 type:complete len:306 (-) Transcript_34780:94-1011(-)